MMEDTTLKATSLAARELEELQEVVECRFTALIARFGVMEAQNLVTIADLAHEREFTMGNIDDMRGVIAEQQKKIEALEKGVETWKKSAHFYNCEDQRHYQQVKELTIANEVLERKCHDLQTSKEMHKESSELHRSECVMLSGELDRVRKENESLRKTFEKPTLTCNVCGTHHPAAARWCNECGQWRGVKVQ